MDSCQQLTGSVSVSEDLLRSSKPGYLLWFLTEEEASEEFGLAEAAADGGDGAVVGSTVIKPPEVEELRLTAHVFSEGFKTRSRGKRIQLQHYAADHCCFFTTSYLISVLDNSLPSAVWVRQKALLMQDSLE